MPHQSRRWLSQCLDTLSAYERGNGADREYALWHSRPFGDASATKLEGQLEGGQPKRTTSFGHKLKASREYMSTPSLELVASTKL
jgi:hypothetical protein